MATYSKSLEDYFRIPIQIKTITPLTEKTQKKVQKSLYYKHYSLTIDERYTRQQQNANTQILINRDPCIQKLYFLPEEFTNDWPEFEVIYKIRYAIGIIDDNCDQKQIQQSLNKTKNEHSVKLIGILNMGSTVYENLIKKQNMIKYIDLSDQQFKLFIEPWLYNCLTFIESDICNMIAQTKKDDETNRTIVFNRMEDKFDPKVMKRKKKYRCTKLCGDYHLMLQLYKEGFAYYSQAEEQLRKLDDYIWILGSLQGKLACTAICQSLNLSNHQQYIDTLISQSYSIAKKTKNWTFQCQNYLKVARLYLNQPQKFDQLIKGFMINYGKTLHQDQKFLLFTVLGHLYDRCGLVRKRNHYYFLASLIHLSKKSELSQVLLIQIQKSKQLKQQPFLYKNILQMIISSSQRCHKTSQYYLELISKCGNNLTVKEIENTLSELNFNNHSILQLSNIDFISLKEFSVNQSKVKPKQNRIGNRQSPRKPVPGFFMSWKKDDNFLFEEDEDIIFKGSVSNSILFPIRLKISFQVCSVANPSLILAKPEMFCYIEPNNLHKFQSKVRLKGATQEIWIINYVQLFIWNFKSRIALPNPIKFQIYEKQPQLDLFVSKQIKCQESSNIYLEADLKASVLSVPFCLIKLNISVYYSVDVGFQQNEITLKKEDHFQGIDFSKSNNLRIIQSRAKEEANIQTIDGIIMIQIKKLKVHRKFVSRIEFTLQYIRSLNTKYQTSKHYVSKCSFYQQFKCQIQEITTPIIQKIYKKNSLSNPKILQKNYKVKLRITKINNSQNSNSYKVYHLDNQYSFKQDNTLTITVLKEKLSESSQNAPLLKECITWRNIFNKIQRGQMEVPIPYHYLMCKCQREVSLKLTEMPDQSNHRKKIIQYSIKSDTPANLSHELTFNSLELEIDRMYILTGKNKVQADNCKKVSNTITVIFSNKCKNSYQLGIVFKDGWIYWHSQLLTIP